MSLYCKNKVILVFLECCKTGPWFQKNTHLHSCFTNKMYHYWLFLSVQAHLCVTKWAVTIFLFVCEEIFYTKHIRLNAFWKSEAAKLYGSSLTDIFFSRCFLSLHVFRPSPHLSLPVMISMYFLLYNLDMAEF